MNFGSKKLIYNFIPKSWFNQSGTDLHFIEANAALNTEININFFQVMNWKNIRIYTPNPPIGGYLKFDIYIDGEVHSSLYISENENSVTKILDEGINLDETNSFKIILSEIPSNFQTGKIYFDLSNSTWECFLNSIAHVANYVDNEIENLKNDLFLKTASGLRLEKWATDISDEERTVYDSDEVYREKLISDILRPKQTKNAIIDAVNNLLASYFPQYFDDPYISGSNSGSNFSAILLEPFYENAPYVAFDDIGQGGRFYLTVPYALLDELSEVAYQSIQRKVEAIKAKGIKVVYLKSVTTSNFIQEKYNKIKEQSSFELNLGYREAISKLVDLSIASQYVSGYEYENFNSLFGNDIMLIDAKNTMEFVAKFDKEEEQFYFNYISFYVGESIIAVDPFVFIKKNHDAGFMQYRNTVSLPSTPVVIFDEISNI